MMKTCFFTLCCLFLGAVNAYFTITNFMQGETFMGCLSGMFTILMIVCVVEMAFKTWEDNEDG